MIRSKIPLLRSLSHDQLQLFATEFRPISETTEIGRGRILNEVSVVVTLSLGVPSNYALKAAEKLEAMGVSTTVADARFAKPIDEALVARLAKYHQTLITVEEGAVGGFGAQVS